MSFIGSLLNNTVSNVAQSFPGFIPNTDALTQGILDQDSDPGDLGAITVQRYIGSIVADITIEEQGSDESTITRHPVEKSADISDHAFAEPSRLSLKVAWSPAGAGGGGYPMGEVPNGGDATPLQTIYQQLLDAKNNFQLLEVQTGKRLYENMLIKVITLVNDQETENALFISLDLQEIILVETQTVTVPDNSVQSDPADTGNTLNAGSQQAIPSPSDYNPNGFIPDQTAADDLFGT